jgi:hypothetical protein
VGTQNSILIYSSGKEPILQQVIPNISPHEMYFHANQLFVVQQPQVNLQKVAVFQHTPLKISWVQKGLFDTYNKESNMVDHSGALFVNACKTSSIKFLSF